MDKQRVIAVFGSVALAAALGLAFLGTAFAQTQPGQGPGMMGGRPTAQVQPLQSLDDARQAFQRNIDATSNPDLALDEVMEFQWNYDASVKEHSTGTGAFELLADPRTGAVFPEMGPNIMWNTRYSPMTPLGGGMMSGTWGPTPPSAPPGVSPDEATQYAQQWLDQYQPGSATKVPAAFPGYYTLDITKDGQITGMLSVNAYTGQVWYHTWHGAFVN